MKTESITWHELPQDGMPDADTTVMLEITTETGATECWPGWWDGERWLDSHGMPIGLDSPTGDVTAWAHMLAGAAAC
jgi:hypothetical protein